MSENKERDVIRVQSLIIKHIDNNIAIANRIISNNYSPSALEYWKRGHDCYALGDYNGGILNYSIAIDLDNSFQEAFNSRAVTKLKIADYNGAIEDCNYVLNLNRRHYLAYFNRALAFLQIGKFEYALNDLNNAVRYCNLPIKNSSKGPIVIAEDLDYIDSEFAHKIFFWRGFVKGKLKDHFGAIADYNEAIIYNPSDEITYYNKGIRLLQLKKYKDASAALTRAIELRPDYAKAYHDRGDCKSRLSDSYGAIIDYDLAIFYDASNPITYCNRAYEKGIIGDYNGAISDYKIALQIDPNDGIAHGGLGTNHFLLGHKKDACESWKMAVSLGRKEFIEAIEDNCK